MAEKRRSRTTARQPQALNQLRGTSRLGPRLAQLRRELPISRLALLISAVRSNAYYTSQILPISLPKTYAEADGTAPIAALGLEFDLAWGIGRCIAEARALRRFVADRDSFDGAMLGGDYTAAGAALERIERTLGQSYWLIEAKSLYLSQAFTHDVLLDYARTVRVSDDVIGGPGLVAYCASLRSDPVTSYQALQNSFDQLLSGPDRASSFGQYLRSLAFHGILENADEAAAIAAQLVWLPLIDCYCAVRRLLLSLSAHDEPRISVDATASAHRLAQLVRDGQLELALRASESTEHLQHLTQATEHQLANRYSEALAEASLILRDQPSHPDALLLAALASPDAESLANLGLPPPLTALLGRLAAVLATGDPTSTDVSETRKWAAGCYETPASVLARALTDVATTRLPSSSVVAAALLSPTAHPVWLQWLPSDASRGSHRLRCLDYEWGPSGIAYISAIAGTTAPEESSIESHVATAGRPGLPPSVRMAMAATLSTRLAEIGQAYYRRIATGIVATALLEQQRTEEAAAVLATAIVHRPTWQFTLPVRSAALQLLDIDGPRSMSDALVLERYVHLYDSSADVDLVEAFCDVLQLGGVTRPSQLVAAPGVWTVSELSRFLRRISTEAIMERSGLFDSSDEVAEERRNVCTTLLSIDPSSADVYQTEIKEITRRLLVAKRLKQVEQSKVYVDVERLRKDMVERLAVSFERYTSLRRGRALPKPSISLTNTDTERPLVVVTMGRDEVTALFEEMVSAIRDNYVSNPDYGLAKYLSVRVRHGTFKAQLWAPLAETALVTPRDAASGGYRRNEEWPPRLFPLDIARQDALAERLRQFSEEYDELLDKTQAWLTISRDRGADGLFSFAIGAAKLGGMEAHVFEDELGLDAFVDRVLAVCDKLLEGSLTRAREMVSGHFKPSAVSLLQRLATYVEQMGPAVSPLTTRIAHATVQLNVAADRVANWFTRAPTVFNEPFALEEAIEVARQVSIRVNPRFSATADLREVSGLHYRGLVMFPLIDVLFIIMDNVIKHSGLASAPVARLRAWREAGSVRIRCDNDLAPAIDIGTLRIRLADIRAAARRGEETQAITREGGTGLHKLARIVSNDLAAKGDYDFGLTDSNRVFVEVTIPDALLVSQ